MLRSVVSTESAAFHQNRNPANCRHYWKLFLKGVGVIGSETGPPLFLEVPLNYKRIYKPKKEKEVLVINLMD